MTSAILWRAMTNRKFRPFSLVMADGEPLRVAHPGLIAHARGTDTAALALSDGSYEIVDLRQVTRMVVGPPADDAPGTEEQK